MPDSRLMQRSSDPDPREPVASIGASLAQRIGSRLGTQGPMNMGYNHAPAYPQGYATDPIVPSVPEQIGIDRNEWATWSPAVRKAVLAGKLPDLSPDGLNKVAENFAVCAPERGFAPPPPSYNPGIPDSPPSSYNPGVPSGPPPSSDNPGVQGGPPPTTQVVGVQPQMPPTTQQAFVAPGGMVYVQAFAAPGGTPLGYYQLPQQMIQPAGQAQGPQYPPLLGWIVLGGALLATAWMLYEITKMKSEMRHGGR